MTSSVSLCPPDQTQLRPARPGLPDGHPGDRLHSWGHLQRVQAVAERDGAGDGAWSPGYWSSQYPNQQTLRRGTECSQCYQLAGGCVWPLQEKAVGGPWSGPGWHVQEVTTGQSGGHLISNM